MREKLSRDAAVIAAASIVAAAWPKIGQETKELLFGADKSDWGDELEQRARATTYVADQIGKAEKRQGDLSKPWRRI